MLRNLLRYLLPLVMGFAVAADDSAPRVTEAWIRAAPAGVKVLAAYFTLFNPGAMPITLTGAASPRFARVELHRTEMKQGIARMRPASTVTVAPGERLAFESGSYHLMLLEPLTPVREGEHIPLTLHFADGTKVDVVAIVRRAREEDHEHHHHE